MSHVETAAEAGVAGSAISNQQSLPRLLDAMQGVAGSDARGTLWRRLTALLRSGHLDVPEHKLPLVSGRLRSLKQAKELPVVILSIAASECRGHPYNQQDYTTINMKIYKYDSSGTWGTRTHP